MAKCVGGARQPPIPLLGGSLASSPLQPDGLEPGAGVFSREEVFLLEGLAWQPWADACCYDNGRRLLCAEQNRGGREGKGMAVEKV